MTIRLRFDVESPPCVWGVQIPPAGTRNVQRITPMCMGSTKNKLGNDCVLGNHPHVYGEYSNRVIAVNSGLESPPCVWGVQ